MRRQQLSLTDQADLAGLERQVAEADGLRLKLEWDAIRRGRTVAALTHREGGELVGYLGVYCFGGPPEAELCGMVAPAQRRAGLGGRLLDAALEVCAAEDLHHRLLVVPRDSVAGVGLARSRGGELEHSEHSMLLRDEPRRVGEDPEVTVRRATEVDRPDLVRFLTDGFGGAPAGMLDPLQREHAWTLVIEHAGTPVGIVRTALRQNVGGIFGFAIDPEHRGRGIGRDVLGRCCAVLRAGGAEVVELQVELANDAALHLYTSTGFAPVSTEDYYRLP